METKPDKEAETKEKPSEINVFIKRGFFDNTKRQLIIHPDFVQFEDKGLEKDSFTRINKDEIAEFRFGINWISGFEFTVGREYLIFIRSIKGEIIKVSFKCFYRIKKQKFQQLYGDIVNAVWDFYFVDIIDDYVKRFNDGEDFELATATISQEGITIMARGIFKSQRKMIAWDKIGIRDYHSYIAVFSEDDKANINQAFYYLKDWNSCVLNAVLLNILQQKKLIKQ